MTVVLKSVSNKPLDVGRRQSLTLQVTSDEAESVTVVIPLGPGGAALMTEDEFKALEIDFDPPDTQLTPTTRDGAARLRLVGDAEIAGELCLHDFLVTTAGTVEIRVDDHDGKTLATTQVKKASTPPRIERFEAAPYNLPRGGTVKLTWEIRPDPGDDLELFIDENRLDLRARALTRQVSGLTDVTLSLRNKAGQAIAQRQLRIHAFGRSGFDGYQLTIPAGSPRKIMGIHAGDGFLCVLLREDNAFASLWKTANGFSDSWGMWREEHWQSGGSAPSPLRIPLLAARRPGVIFQDRLWLIGGDWCHPDRPLSRVGSYDFQADGSFRDEVAPWPARMGHAVIRTDDRHIWVAGGWRQGGGALNDIWQFNGTNWTKLPAPPWRPRCLFGAAATATDVWIAGGFDVPGGKTYDDIWCFSKSKKEWKKIDPILREKEDRQYVAGSLFVLRDIPYALTVEYDPNASEYLVFLRKIYNSDGKWAKEVYEVKDEHATGIFEMLDYYALNTTVFSHAMFLSVVMPSLGSLDDRDSFVHYYMILEGKS